MSVVPVIRYCCDLEYNLLSDLAGLLTELNIERSALLKTEEYFFASLLDSLPTISDEASRSLNSTQSAINSVQICAENEHAKNEFDESSGVHDAIGSQSIADESIYNAQVFTDKLKSLIDRCSKFKIEYKIKLLKNVSKCLFHHFLASNNLHTSNKRCTYELLFDLIDKLKIVDLAFCLYVISELKLCDDLFNILFELNSSAIDSIIDMYFKIIDLRSNDGSKLALFKDDQLFRLNITFAISSIRMLFQNKHNSQLVDKYNLMLERLIKFIQQSDEVLIEYAAYEYLRLYSFLIEMFLSDLINVASKSTGLHLKYTQGQQLSSFYTPSIKITDNELLKVFGICYETICTLFEVKKFKSKMKLWRKKVDLTLMLQRQINQMIDVWKFIKKYLIQCDINLTSYEFVLDSRSSTTGEMNFVYDYLSKQKNGYLFLAYCFIKSQDIKIVRDVITCLDSSMFLHPKLIYLMAERAFIEREQGLFLVEIFQRLVADLEDETIIRAYLRFHFEHFSFNKLAVVDMNKKREILNRADTSTIKFVKKEIIKLALVDPLQVLFYLINFSSLINRTLLELICELVCNEMKPHCMFEVLVGNFNCNFLTSLINFKIKTFEYCDLEALCYFLKYVAFYTDSNKINGLIEFEKLILVTIQNENLENIEILKKKLYFLQTIIDLCEMFKVTFDQIPEHCSALFIFLLQTINLFWNETKFKTYALNLLQFFKRDAGRLNKNEQIWLKSQLKSRSFQKMVPFYLADLFDDQLNEMIDFEDLNELLYLNAINDQDEHAYFFLRNRMIDNELTEDTKKEIKKFITENDEALTRTEHLNLFNLLINYLPVSDLLIGYVKEACDCRVKYPIEIVHYIVKNTLFKKSKLLDLLLGEAKYLDEIKLFFNYLNEVKDNVASFYDESKFANLTIEIDKFIYQHSQN